MLIKANLRQTDRQGSGAYLAPRGKGRKHKGIDIACMEGSIILAVTSGIVTKIGYPYDPSDPKKGHLRYVQITDVSNNKARYFYVKPTVKLHQKINTHDEIGIAQGLTNIYPGITDHFHFEVMRGLDYIDPNKYLGELNDSA